MKRLLQLSFFCVSFIINDIKGWRNQYTGRFQEESKTAPNCGTTLHTHP